MYTIKGQLKVVLFDVASTSKVIDKKIAISKMKKALDIV